MKFRISPAAAAVFLAAGLFTSGLRAASAPAAIPFENDAAFNVTLSNTNPSKVVVDGELITSISGPTGAYDQSQEVFDRLLSDYEPLNLSAWEHLKHQAETEGLTVSIVSNWYQEEVRTVWPEKKPDLKFLHKVTDGNEKIGEE